MDYFVSQTGLKLVISRMKFCTEKQNPIPTYLLCTENEDRLKAFRQITYLRYKKNKESEDTGGYNVSTLSPDMITFLNRHLISRGANTKVTSLAEFSELDTVEIAKRYMRIIIHMSKKYARDGIIDSDDLIMEGVLGLLDAIERYEPKRNENFHKLAMERINGKMYDYFLKNKQSVHIPRYIAIVMSHLEAMRGKLSGITNDQGFINDVIRGRENPPELAEISEKIDRDIDSLKQKVENVARSQLNSDYEYIVEKAKGEIDYVEIDGGLTDFVVDEMITPKSAEESVELKQIKERFIEFASKHFSSKRPVEIIYLHLMRGLTQTEIHNETGLTKSYISHVIKVFREAVVDSDVYHELKQLSGGVIAT